MGVAYNIHLLSDAAEEAETPLDTKDRQPGSLNLCPGPLVSRHLEGRLVCCAQLGTTVSMMPIDANTCGSATGCGGTWHCMLGKAPSAVELRS